VVTAEQRSIIYRSDDLVDSARIPRRSSFGGGRRVAGSRARGMGARVTVPVWASLSSAGDCGVGIGFTVFRNGEIIPAFIVRFNGRVHAYLNRCAHRRLKLNWNAGEFFDASGNHLLCATHGARYAPASGKCVGGPCGRASLVKLAVTEYAGDISLETTDDIHLVETRRVTRG
jgi:nitrite reductase/ring-hydroxylating ferredoxin subunit